MTWHSLMYPASLILLLIVFTLPVLGQTEVDGEPADTSLTVEEGFSGSTSSDIDYEALVKELYGQEEQVKTPEKVSAPQEKETRDVVVGPAPGMFKNSFLNGSHLAFNASSPFAVSEQLSSWYSYIDASVTIKLPFEVDVESIPLYILLEVSSFSFENTHPAGGDFTGIAYIMQASTIGDHSGATVGFGFWDKTLGSMLEMNYRFRPTKNTFFRLGTRGVLITNIEPMGNAWWLELRLSTGFEF